MRQTEMRWTLLLVLIILLASAGTVLASGGGEGVEFESILSMAMFWRIVNFSVLMIIIVKFVFKPLGEYFSGRREQILTALEESKRNKEEAEARYKELSDRLANREQEFEEIRRTAIESAEKTKIQIITDAQAKAARMEEKARESIEQELKKAKESLKSEAAELALKLSGERLIKEIGSGDHKRFMDEYIAGLK